jgi:HD-GYP domain-containing protein (c-di-GMP phosphodiesterase class II)
MKMLESIDVPPEVRDIVLYHHENFDGTGYPRQVSGESIPIGARIIRVADSFKALVSERPYQKRYTVNEAIEVLKHRSGTFFDPIVVDAFINALQENKTKFKSTKTEELSDMEEQTVLNIEHEN